MPATAASARDLAAATPADRDRTVDALRAVAIAVVVLGHWLMAVVAVDPATGSLEVGNLLEVEPWTRRLTWVLQVMPLFFLVGGFAGAASWGAAERAGASYGAWLHGRLRRLLLPVVPLVVLWTAGLAAAGAAGIDRDLLDGAGRVAAMPLWFLAVFVAAVATTPVAVRADRAVGLAAPVLLGAGALVVDVAGRGLGVSVVGWANFAFVWLLAHQLGVAWRSGTLVPSRRTGAALAAAGLAALLVLTSVAGYGTSLVGAWEGERSNTDPPSLALVAATLLQAGLAFATRPALARLVARRRVWQAVVAANGVAMTAFCWHLTAAVAVAAGLVGTGVLVPAEAATASWWWQRPVWVAAAALALVPLVAALARVERRAVVAPAVPATAAQAVTAAAIAVAALTALALGGFPILG